MQRSITPVKTLVANTYKIILGKKSGAMSTTKFVRNQGAVASALGTAEHVHASEGHVVDAEHVDVDLPKNLLVNEERIQIALREWEQNVDTSSFSDQDKEIHRVHLKAVKVFNII